jgi:hypothetical protein
VVDSKILQIIIRAKDATGPAFSSAQKAAAGVGVGMMAAGAVIIGALDAATNAAVAYGQEVVDVQRLTGLGAEESSKWAAILDRYGVSGKSAGMVIKTLSTQIVAHNKALNAAGIATQDSTGANRSATAVLADLAQYYSTATDKTAATALAAKVLGRGYMSLLPILANGAAGIDDVAESAKRAGLILGQDSIDAVKRYSKALKDNEEASKGFEVQVGLMVLPIKTQLIKVIGDVLGWFQQLDPGMKQFIVTGAELSAGVLILGGLLLTLALAQAAVATGAGVLATSFAGTAIGAVAAAFAVGGLSAAMETLSVAIATSPAGWIAAAAGVGLLTGAIIDQIPVIKEWQQRAGEGWANLKSYASYQQDANNAMGASADVQAEMAKMYDANTGALTDYGRQVKAQEDAQGKAAAATTVAANAQNGLTTAVDGTTHAWQAETLVMSVGRSAREAALANVLAVKDAQDALTAARKKGDPTAIALATMKLDDAQKLATQTADDMTKKQIIAAVKAHAMTIAQGDEALAAKGLTEHLKMVNGQLKLIKDKHATVTIDVKNGIGAIFASGAGFKLGLTGWLVARAKKAAGDIVSARGNGVDVTVAENGHNETLMNWGAGAARNLALLAATAKGGAFGPMPSFAGGGSSAPSGSSNRVNERLLAVLERIERNGVQSNIDGHAVSRALGRVTTDSSRTGRR